MKIHLFIAGFVITYVTIATAIMYKWIKADDSDTDE